MLFIYIHFFFREPYVVAQAATLLVALMWGSVVNKAIVSSMGACTVLVKRLIRHAAESDDENILCLEQLSYALASLLLHEATHELMIDIGGFDETIRICKRSASDRVLRCLSQIIVAIIPSPDYLVVRNEIRLNLCPFCMLY